MRRRRLDSDHLGRSARLLAVALFLTLAKGCAAGPQVGVRSEYTSETLRSASVSPFFTRSAFSLSSGNLDERLRWAEEAATNWLAERGVEVIGPGQTREQLESADKWNHFTANGTFHVDLAESFESAPRDARNETQRSVLRELLEKEVTERFLLFGELLYQTSGECRETADDHTARANVVIADDAPSSLPRPCVVTHFQARLVDAASGTTVWYNRRLREHHLPSVDASDIRRNIRSTVRRTLAGDDGLHGLVDPEPGES